MKRLPWLGALLVGALSGCSPTSILNATVSDAGVSQTTDIAYAPGSRRTLDVYRPSMPGSGRPLIVFIYGGSWRGGSKSMYPFVARPLAQRGAVVVVPDYRVYPEVTYPSFLEDNALAVAWAFAHARELGADPAKIVLLGHSAGAFDVAMLALDPRWLRAAGIDRDRLAGTVGLAGPYHFLPTTDSDVIPVFGPDNTPAHEPYAVADGHNSPILLMAGNEDTTVRPHNTLDLAARLRSIGGPVADKIYPNLAHIGIITAFAPLFDRRAPVLDDVWAFVTRVTGQRRP